MENIIEKKVAAGSAAGSASTSTTAETASAATATATDTAQAKPLTKRVKSWYTWASIALLIQILIVNVLQGVCVAGFTDFFNKYQMLMAAICVLPANITATIIALKAMKSTGVKHYIRKPQNIGIGGIIMACLGCIGIAEVNVLIMSVLTPVFGSTSQVVGNTIGTAFAGDNIFITVISLGYITLLGPIFEEALFRCAALRLTAVVSPLFGIVASGFLFGLFHGNISQLFNATIMGIFLGYMAFKTKSAVVPMIMHIANNSKSMIDMAVGSSLSPEQSSVYSSVSVAGFAIIGMICLIFLLRKFGKIRKDETYIDLPYHNVTKEEIAAYSGSRASITAAPFFLNWAFILMFLIEAGTTIFVMVISNR